MIVEVRERGVGGEAVEGREAVGERVATLVGVVVEDEVAFAISEGDGEVVEAVYEGVVLEQQVGVTVGVEVCDEGSGGGGVRGQRGGVEGRCVHGAIAVAGVDAGAEDEVGYAVAVEIAERGWDAGGWEWLLVEGAASVAVEDGVVPDDVEFAIIVEIECD